HQSPRRSISDRPNLRQNLATALTVPGTLTVVDRNHRHNTQIVLHAALNPPSPVVRNQEHRLVRKIQSGPSIQRVHNLRSVRGSHLRINPDSPLNLPGSRVHLSVEIPRALNTNQRKTWDVSVTGRGHGDVRPPINEGVQMSQAGLFVQDRKST